MYNNNVISDDYFTFLNNLSKLFNVTVLIRVFYISKRILTIKMFRAVCVEKRSQTVLREFDISIT